MVYWNWASLFPALILSILCHCIAHLCSPSALPVANLFSYLFSLPISDWKFHCPHYCCFSVAAGQSPRQGVSREELILDFALVFQYHSLFGRLLSLYINLSVFFILPCLSSCTPGLWCAYCDPIVRLTLISWHLALFICQRRPEEIKSTCCHYWSRI